MAKKGFVKKYVSENYPNLHRELIDLIYTNGYDYVDMGEAGKWATCNVGATSPKESGLYFQWGDIQGYTKNQVKRGEKIFDMYNYKFFSEGFTKYCNDERAGEGGFTDNLTTLELEDDAAQVHMGGAWRMPTKDEFDKLFDLCKYSWINNYEGTGVDGIELVLPDDMSKTLFFPSTGYAYKSDISDKDYTYMWSSSLNTSDPSGGQGLVYISMDQTPLVRPYDRGLGFPVRGILGVGK